MKRSRIVLAGLLLATAAVSANAALVKGSIAFTSFNGNEDGWSIVALDDIAASTTIFFRDDEWTGSAWDSSTEGRLTWNTGLSTIAAGTVVRFSRTDNDTLRAASIGTLTNNNASDTGTSASAETIYAFLGTDVNTPTTFLAGVSTDGTAGSTQLNNAGLTPGSYGVQLPTGADYGQYTGARSGQGAFALYRTLVNNASNWSSFTDGAGANFVPNTTAFAVNAVPLPAAAWLMLSGLGALGAAARRRRKA